MDRWEALYSFWSSFGWPAYEENSVPEDAEMPYVTYEAAAGGFGDVLPLSASLWTRGGSWAEADAKADEIDAYIKGMGCPEISGGRYRAFTGGAFAQSMGDPGDKMVKRKALNVSFEFMA